MEASFLSFGFLLGFFGFDGICFRGIEPEEDFPGMSTVSNTEFSAALAKVLVEAKNTSSFSSSDNRGE